MSPKKSFSQGLRLSAIFLLTALITSACNSSGGGGDGSGGGGAGGSSAGPGGGSAAAVAGTASSAPSAAVISLNASINQAPQYAMSLSDVQALSNQGLLADGDSDLLNQLSQ